MNAPTEYTVPLPGGGGQRVFTFTGTFPLTGAEWEFVMSVLAVMRPGLVKDPGPAPDADPGYWPAAAGEGRRAVNDGGPSACSIVVTTVAEGCQVITYSAAEARRYAEAFTRAAEVHDGNHGGAR